MTTPTKGPDLLSPSALFASGLAGTDRLLVLGEDRSVSGHVLLESVRQFTRQLTEIGPCRVAVSASRAENVLAAIGASIHAGSELILLPEADSLDHPLLSDAQVCALFGDDLKLIARAEGLRSEKAALILPAKDGTRLVLQDLDFFISRVPKLKSPGCWMLALPPTTFAGLLVLLTAFGSSGILLPYPELSVPQLAQRAIAHQVSHFCGTPIQVRSLLRALKEQPGKAAFKQITLLEEIAPPSLLDELRTSFPKARVTQLYGSAEGGLLFSVHDGLPGLPVEWLGQGVEGCELRITEGRLEVLSPGVMRGFIGKPGPLPFSSDGWFKPGYAAVREDNRVLLREA